MNGINRLSPPAVAEKAHPLVGSAFSQLPDEMILKIFRCLSQELPAIRSVCTEFKRLADDVSLLKDEIQAVREVVSMLDPRRQERVEHILASEEGAQLKLFQLIAVFREAVQQSSPSSIARLAPDPGVMAKAPLTGRYVAKICRAFWVSHIRKQLEEHQSFRLDFSFTEGAFTSFLEGLRVVGGPLPFTFSFVVDEQTCGLIARAMQEGELNASSVCIVSDHFNHSNMLETYLRGVEALKGVKSLRFSNCALYADEFQLIREALRGSTAVESLRVNDFALNPESMEELAGLLEEHPEITSLELSGCSHAELEGVLQNINRTSIRRLKLTNVSFLPDTVSCVNSAIPGLEKVEVFELEGKNFLNDDIKELAETASRQRPGLDLRLPALKVDLSPLRRMGFML